MNKYIDHTLLKAFATTEDIKKLCLEAMKYHFKSVCVNPAFVSYAKELLKDSDVLVCTVIGFPLGANTISIKTQETADALNNGADEIDMVINIGKAKEHDYEYIYQEIKHVISAANGKTVKVIMETCYLTDEEKINICKAATKAGANFVKTSTGFGTGGATLVDVALMKANISKNMGVKASGGIRTYANCDAFIKAGATRIGTSNGVTILEQKQAKEEY